MKRLIETAKILAVLAVMLGVAGAVFFQTNTAHATNYPITGQNFFLSGAGVTSSQVTVPLTSLKTPSGIPITMTMVGTKGYGTLEPQSPAKTEIITFTGISQNGNGTAVLTGVTRGIDFAYPYAASTTLRQAHAGGSTFIISNTPNWYYDNFPIQGDDNVTVWPAASTSVATRGYVDYVAFNGASVINASTLAKGVVQIATAAQAAASTAAGSSGALLALPASVATSTRNMATAANVIPVTALNGYLDNNFISPYGSTTLAASSTALLTLHQLPYNFPSVRGATSTALSEDGAGNLTWEGLSGLYTASSSAQNITGTTASSTLYTTSIPANTLKPGYQVVITMYGTQATGGASPNYYDIGYGTGSTTVANNSNPNGTSNFMLKYILNVGGLTSQNTVLTIGSSTTSTFAEGAISSDTTTNLNLVIVGRPAGSGNTLNPVFATTEILRK